MTDLIKYMFQIKYIHVFNMITRINKSKIFKKNMYHANVNVNLMVKNVIQIKSGTTRNAGANVKILKNIMCGKKILFRILLHVVAKMVNILKVLLIIQLLRVIKL